MIIGSKTFSNNLILAPMAGITDHPFRKICRDEGCGLVFSEMISARGLMDLAPKIIDEMAISLKKDKPIAVQFFGSDPVILSEAAVIAEKIFQADIVDLNMGCPARKILKNKEGAWLMRNPVQTALIIEKVVKSVNIPVTIKIRKGWQDCLSAVEISLLAEHAGAKAVTVHGRTVEQGFSGKADWDIVKDIKKGLSIPVIGSGDIWEPANIKKIFEYCDCDGVMVGRGALGNPWIFSRTGKWFQTGSLPPETSIQEKASKALLHLDLLIDEKGEERASKEMRKHAHWYLKFFYSAGSLKNDINKAKSKKDFEIIFNRFIESKSNGG